MSKLDYSTYISNLAPRKMLSIFDDVLIDELFEKDGFYMLSLCIAYLTLSKEKIIEKDKNNRDKLSRLNKYVDAKDVDRVFDPSFCKLMPVIHDADCSDNLWILDNFRDSIMHGKFEMDLENNNIIIDNDGFDRKLKATIPFDWLYNYALYDINSKRLKDRYCIKGAFYNAYANDKWNYNRNFVIDNTIFYQVYIKGNQFNINQIEKRIKELFMAYCTEKITPETDTTKLYIPRTYPKRYFCSFKAARSKIIKQMKEEYNVDLEIKIMSPNNELIKKAKANKNSFASTYDSEYNSLNNIFAKKSDRMLKVLSLIIENNGKSYNMSFKEFLSNLDDILKEYTYKRELNYATLKDNQRLIADLFVTVFGISTFVINKEYLEELVIDSDLLQLFEVYSKRTRISDNDRLSALKREMLKNNATFNKLYSSSKLCPKEDKRKVMEKEILDIREKMYNMALEYNELINVEKRAFKIDKSSLKEIYNLESEKCSLQEIEDISDALCEESGLVKSNDFTDDINDLDQQIDKIISNYTFSKSHNEIEKLTLIRNSLSHVGRVNTAFCKFGRADINFYDYDDNNHLAGYINCNYYGFIETIFRLFERKKVKVKK